MGFPYQMETAQTDSLESPISDFRLQVGLHVRNSHERVGEFIEQAFHDIRNVRVGCAREWWNRAIRQTATGVKISVAGSNPSLPAKFFIFCCVCKCFHTEPTGYAPFVETVAFVRTRHIPLRLTRRKGNSTLRICNAEPSRCHNEDMKAGAYRNKSENN